MTASLAPLPERTDPLVRGSVDSYLVTDVPLCGPDVPMAELHAMLVGRPYESTADVAVCASDDGTAHRLLGLIPLEKVLAAEPTRLARDLMDTTRRSSPRGSIRRRRLGRPPTTASPASPWSTPTVSSAAWCRRRVCSR